MFSGSVDTSVHQNVECFFQQW